MEKEELEAYKKAGKICSEAREFGKSLIKPGVKIIDVLDKIEEKIFQLGGKPAFPAQISLNEAAAHYCSAPDDLTEFKQGDLACLDIGVHFDGYVADTACTVDLGNNAKLVEASQKALENALKIIKPGIALNEIGKVIEKTITSYGFKPVRNLTGHGVGQFIIHGPPTIPNYDNEDETVLEKGDVIAIEPFATNGAGLVAEKGRAEVFMLVNRQPVRNPITKKVLNEILNYEGLPFTTRWLAKKFPLPQVRLALAELKRLDVIRDYPPLLDKGNGLVSQAEHTIIVEDKIEIITK